MASKLTILTQGQGICNAPGTAKAITELVMDGRIRSENINITSLEPLRFL